MAPNKEQQMGDSGTSPESHRLIPTPFLTKTYQLVDDPAVDDIIRWNDDGTAFIVWRPAEFARDLLPKYFKHNNFSSFVRQLNTYGFRKIVPDRWEFANDSFRKGEKRLLCDIHRRKINATAAIPVAIPVIRAESSPGSSVEEQGQCSNSSPPGAMSSDLADENERLRKENMQLNRELSQMRSLCNNIMLLMSNYQQSPERGIPSAPAPVPLPAPLEFTSDKRFNGEVTCQESPKQEESPILFGVHIGVKRLRVEEVRQPANAEDPPRKSQNLHPRVAMKSELDDGPFDPVLEECRNGLGFLGQVASDRGPSD